MKRAVSIIVCLLMLTVLFSGCKSNDEAATDSGIVSATAVISVTDTVSTEASENTVEYDIENVSSTGKDGSFTCEYAGEKYGFVLCPPDENGDNVETPLILALHGYGNNADAMRLMTHLDETAFSRGYAVAYISSAKPGWNCGLGDSDLDDVGFLKKLAAYLQESYGFDPERTFAVGFSNGAFMTQRLAVDAQDTFAAVASVAGMMPQSVWDSRAEKSDIGVLEIYGTKDDVVPKKSDDSYKTAGAPAIEDVMEYWAASNGLTERETVDLSDKSVCFKASGSSGGNVWLVAVTDGRHSWPDVKFAGFDTNELILDFFDLFE